MDQTERKERFRQLFRRWKDWWTLPDFRFGMQHLTPQKNAYPIIPPKDQAPDALRNALQFDSDRILSGSWTLFRQLGLKIDRHPKWQKDYLANTDLATPKSSTHLDHRKLPNGADVKLIWELSRWTHLVRLAQEAYILNDRWTMKIAIRRVYHWTKQNQPMNGYNWTSPLEAGLRLINYCWIDALTMAGAANKKLGDESPELTQALNRLRQLVLPPHVWFIWRYKSFGSSANNHLLGELAGLICALTRWPQLEYWTAPLDTIQNLWEDEILKQFAPDGGNCEQALNYHLFSFELCWQAYLALKSVAKTIRPQTYQRLQLAADFFTIVQVRKEPWDYGDSDDAFVTPLWEKENEIPQEWVRWLESTDNDTCIHYWLGDPPPMSQDIKTACQEIANGWFYFPQTGIATCLIQGLWQIRWDLTPLGYLRTAAHGHLDALHISLWYKELAFIIDPGTGAYYGDLPARNYLTNWTAHNGPHLLNTNYPKRKGPFLWGETHPKPTFHPQSDQHLYATLTLPSGTMRRDLTMLPKQNTWHIEDTFTAKQKNSTSKQPINHLTLEVCWQFAPGCQVEKINDRTFRIHRIEGASLQITLSESWATIEWFIPTQYEHFNHSTDDLRGLCSPSFRTLQRGPRLTLHGPASEKHLTSIRGE